MKKLAQIIGLTLGLSFLPTACNQELKVVQSNVQPKTVQVQPKFNVEARLCNNYATTVITQDNELKYRVENKGLEDVMPVCISFNTENPFNNHIKSKDCYPSLAKLGWIEDGISKDGFKVSGDIKPKDVILKQEGNKVSIVVKGYTALCR